LRAGVELLWTRAELLSTGVELLSTGVELLSTRVELLSTRVRLIAHSPDWHEPHRSWNRNEINNLRVNLTRIEAMMGRSGSPAS
jgi:hypothetical protein